MSSEQHHTVTEIKTECSDVKLDAETHLSKAKRSMAWMEDRQGEVTVMEMDQRILFSYVTPSAVITDQLCFP